MPYFEIHYPFPATMQEIERAENDVCRLLLGDDSPLIKYLHMEVTFDTFPFPSCDMVTGRVSIKGEIPELLFKVYTCSQKYSVKHGVPTLQLRGYNLLETTEEAYLSYLTSFLKKRHGSNLASRKLKRVRTDEGQDLLFSLEVPK